MLLNQNYTVEEILPNPEHVIHADFFSDDFQSDFRECFDIVISRGFIEHFKDVNWAIKKHLNLLAKGGCLIVNIPNLRGISFTMTWIFNRPGMSRHNLAIMRKGEFLKLFRKEGLSCTFCDYYGTFDLIFPESLQNRNTALCKAMKICHVWLTSLSNLCLHLFFKKGGFESVFFSPYLIFIGTKM